MATSLEAIDALIQRLSKPKSKQVINIFCFGDSLTHGTYNDNFFDKAPYSHTLYKLIKSYLRDDGIKLSIKTKGIPGQCAVDMKDNLGKYLTRHKNGEYHIDLMIILGGTNDIAQGYYENEQIISSILNLHRSCYSVGILKTVLITIPECKNQTTKLVEIRNDINKKLIEFYQDNKDKMYLFDMNTIMKYNENDNLWSSDGIHLTPFGYQTMAHHIFNLLQQSWLKLMTK